VPGSSPAAGPEYWPSQASSAARDLECHLLRRSKWLRVGVAAARVPTLADRLPLLSPVAPEPAPGNTCTACCVSSSVRRVGRSPQPCWHHRQPVGENDGRWRRTRLRWGQPRQWPQASHPGRQPKASCCGRKCTRRTLRIALPCPCCWRELRNTSPASSTGDVGGPGLHGEW